MDNFEAIKVQSNCYGDFEKNEANEFLNVNCNFWYF